MDKEDGTLETKNPYARKALKHTYMRLKAHFRSFIILSKLQSANPETPLPQNADSFFRLITFRPNKAVHEGHSAWKIIIVLGVTMMLAVITQTCSCGHLL